MPTYDYSCESCGSKFELRLKFSDEVDQPCSVEECGAIAKRQFSVVPIVFKGSGWYVNDYGKKGSSSGNAPDSTSAEKPSASSDSAPDSGKNKSSSDAKGSKSSTKSENKPSSSNKSASSD